MRTDTEIKVCCFRKDTVVLLEQGSKGGEAIGETFLPLYLRRVMILQSLLHRNANATTKP